MLSTVKWERSQRKENQTECGSPGSTVLKGRGNPVKATGSGEDSLGRGRSAEQNVGQDLQAGKSFPEGAHGFGAWP